MRFRKSLGLIGFALFVGLGYWLARSAVPAPDVAAAGPATPEPSRRPPLIDEPPVRFRSGDRAPARLHDRAARAAGALEGERILIFANADALARFLAEVGDGIRILGRLDSLNALRVGFDDPDSLAGLLGDDAEESFIYPVTLPIPPEAGAQAGAAALGDGLHEWLGITGDNSAWGAGVRIAVLDTGVDAHSAFGGEIRSIHLVDGPGSDLHGHGTAVASIIVSGDSFLPGIAPGAELIAIRIADANGVSDSFLLAQGILAAVDAGARLINISMGSFGDSVLVRNAIAYAGERGALIIAAAGNNGIDRLAYPAAYDGVLGVGAVDAHGNHLAFSNTGEQLAAAAPGFGLNAAWTDNQVARMSGTSFSAPVITGAIAAVMTEAGTGKLTPAQAWSRLSATLNDAGPAGPDPQFGSGMPDIGRVMQAGTPGIYDAAVASNRILPPTPTTPFGEVEVLVQNRGTETLINTGVTVSVGGRTVNSNITTLPPNAVRTVRVPLSNPLPESGTLKIDSRVNLSGGVRDAKPANNRRAETYGQGAK